MRQQVFLGRACGRARSGTKILGFDGRFNMFGALGKNPPQLTWVTGFREVTHKKAGLVVRLFEMDGSSTVAMNPVRLVLFVTDAAPDNGVSEAWMLRRNVSRVTSMRPSTCGLDLFVDVDHMNEEGSILSTVPVLLKLCFLSSTGAVEKTLRMTQIFLEKQSPPRSPTLRAKRAPDSGQSGEGRRPE